MPFALDFQRTPVTIILMSVMGLLELLSQIGPFQGDVEARNRFYQVLGLTYQIWGWELWRPFTTTLLHADLIHAVFNIYFLVIFGAAIENWVGSGRMLAIVLLFAYGSTMAEYTISNYHHPKAGMVGFSGVNYGFFGLLLVGRRYRTDFAYICNPTTVQLLIGWFFLCILLTMMKVWNVANTAHGAGFIFGYLLGQSIFTIRRRALWRAATVVATVAMLGTLLWCPWHAGFQLMKRHPAPYRPLLQRAVEPAGYVAEATLAERADPGSAPHSQQRGGPD